MRQIKFVCLMVLGLLAGDDLNVAIYNAELQCNKGSLNENR